MQVLRSCLLVCCLLGGPLGRPTLAQELLAADGYAVETSVTVAGSPPDQPPLLTTTTVFLGRRAYDAVHGNPVRLACFDFETQEIFFLAPADKKRTRVTFAEVLRFQSDLRAVALKRGGLAAFLADPTFIHEFDANKSTIKLSSPWVSYEAEVRTASFDEVERFVAFADWAARVAGMLHPSAPPASARVALNRALQKQNWLPVRVTRTSGPRSRVLGGIRSDHVIRRELSADDRGLSEEIQKGLQEFTTVSFSEYRNLQNTPRAITKK